MKLVLTVFIQLYFVMTASASPVFDNTVGSWSDGFSDTDGMLIQSLSNVTCRDKIVYLTDPSQSGSFMTTRIVPPDSDGWLQITLTATIPLGAAIEVEVLADDKSTVLAMYRVTNSAQNSFALPVDGSIYLRITLIPTKNLSPILDKINVSHKLSNPSLRDAIDWAPDKYETAATLGLGLSTYLSTLPANRFTLGYALSIYKPIWRGKYNDPLQFTFAINSSVGWGGDMDESNDDNRPMANSSFDFTAVPRLDVDLLFGTVFGLHLGAATGFQLQSKEAIEVGWLLGGIFGISFRLGHPLHRLRMDMQMMKALSLTEKNLRFDGGYLLMTLGYEFPL